MAWGVGSPLVGAWPAHARAHRRRPCPPTSGGPAHFRVQLAAYTLGAGWAFLLVTLASAVGMALPFLLSKHVLHDRARAWVGGRDWFAALLLAVREAGPWKCVFLLRLGPVPYAPMNYGAALSPDVTFWPYILASVPGHTPDVALHVFFGRTLVGINDVIQGRKHLDASTILRYVVPLLASIAIAATCSASRGASVNPRAPKAQRTNTPGRAPGGRPASGSWSAVATRIEARPSST